LPRFVLSALVPEPVSEFLLGDLEEDFVRAVQTRGRAFARRRYWKRSLVAAWHGRGLSERRRTPRGSLNMWNLWRDLILGVRTAVRSPGYSAIAIVTLALAIGANTVLFSIANPLVVRSLPVKDPDTLGWVSMLNPAAGVTSRGRASVADFLDWRAGSQGFSAMAAYDTREATLTGLGDAERILTARATTSLVDVWGLSPMTGRLFQAGEDAPGREAVGVLSHRYWRERFNASPEALQRPLLLDGRSITLIGVMKPEIEIGNLALIDMWTLLPLDAASPRDARTIRAVGRLKPGVSLEAASAEIAGISARLAADHPDTNHGWVASVVSTLDALASPDTWVILALLGVVVVFVLFIACVNLANLVLARTVARRHDFAVQSALGASRLQLIRPLMCESLILSLAGGAAGLALAAASLRAINAAAYEPFLRTVGIDANVLVFTTLISLATPLLFSLWPAWSAGRAPAIEAIRESRGSAGRQSGRRRAVLIASQVALALSLLVVSGLVVQSMLYLRRLDLGIDVPKLLTYRFELPADRYADGTAHAQFAADITQALAAMPRATGATVATHLPVFDGEARRRLSGTRHDGPTEDERPWASWYAVTPGFFDTAGVGLLAGRVFEAADRAGAQPVAILGRLAAERYFDEIPQAIGRTLVISGGGKADVTVSVVGVVEDTRDAQVVTTSPQVYVPFDQAPAPAMTVLVRSDTAVDPADVRALMRRQDPNVAVSNLKTLHQLVEEELSSSNIINGLFVGFALLALALAAAGLYGVISYSVGQRRREFGVRLALGAAPGSIRRMVLGEGLRVVAIGAVLGLGLAGLLAQATRSLLYGISAGDPVTFAGVTALVLLVGVAAMWAPAARAMRVDPARTLKAD
jgi:putative ABC transport system permease protein